MKNQSFIKIQVLLLTIGIFASCSTDADWKFYALKGKVKSFTETHYNVKNVDGKWVQGDSIKGNVITRVTFDDKKRRICTERFRSDKELVMKSVPVREKGLVVAEEQYGKDGNLISKMVIKHLSKDDYETITYNKDGIEQSRSKSFLTSEADNQHTYRTIEGDAMTFVYEFDKDGRMLSQKSTSEIMDFNNKQTYEYIAFDKHKNWTKLLGYELEVGKEPRFMVIREYVYY